MAMKFHSHTGSLVTLLNGGKTAQRNQPVQEFNNGVVLSAEALKDDQLFEVRIDRKVNSWSGSIEIGVTTCDPNMLDFPTSATGFREGTWVMSGCSIMKDGHTTIDDYGQDLDQLQEGDRVGVIRSSGGALHFYVNGTDQGEAATGVPAPVFAVVDMYGKCAQVTAMDGSDLEQALCNVLSNDLTNEAIAEASAAAAFASSTVSGATCAATLNDRLVFHERCGSLVKLTNNRRTAERRKPLDEFNNGVVMTNRPVRDNEMFEIRLDRLVDKWSGSIEVGVTTHNPSNLEFPATMTNMRSGKSSAVQDPSMFLTGTIMMSGCGILTNGKGTRREYGEYNLDELQEGDRIALMRKSNGALHYYVNGMDQGVAATKTPQTVWGVVDLYGMAVKVTIIESDPTSVRSRHSNNSFVSNAMADLVVEEEEFSCRETEKLLFHPQCGTHAAVIKGQRTAHRPNALEDFNNGVVLTNRILRPGEMFEVRVDVTVEKWAGSIEIGVTSHSPLELDFPSTMTNIRSGTWMMTGNGVMHNGATVIEEYGQNLDRLKVGDRVGLMRSGDGTLRFYVNGEDQGVAASCVPNNVYGVMDLYGQAAQCTIVDQSDPMNIPEVEVTEDIGRLDDLRFHHLHGKNATISNNGKTASRPNAHGEFNDAIVISSRSLHDDELFEVTIDKMVDRWSGAIEAGVTLIQPEALDFPNTMTDIDYDTWMLSGSAIMQDGATIRNGYRLDLDTLSAGTRIGMMRCSDATLHYYHDGLDMGVACTNIPTGLFAVVDLYGQCAQVTITSGAGVRPMDNHLTTTSMADIEPSLSSPLSTIEMTHRFSQCAGKNIALKNNCSTACRVRNFDNGLAFSADPLRADELFEIRVDQLQRQWSGSLQIGLTSMAISDSTPLSVLPPFATDLRSKVTWVVTGSEVKKNGVTVKENYAPSLDRLEIGDRVGIKRCADGTMHVFLNGEDLGVAACNVPRNVFALLDLYGMIDQVTIISSVYSGVFNSSRPPSIPTTDSEEDYVEDEQDLDTAEACYLEFHGNHGRNIQLTNRNLTGTRTASYNQAIVVTHKPLLRNHVFKVRINRLNTNWTSSLMIGLIAFSPDMYAYTLPVSAVSIKKPSWVIQGDSVFQSGIKVKERYGPNLDSLQTGHAIGISVDDDNCFHLHVNDVDQGIAARDIPKSCYALIDLYGQCEQVTIVTADDDAMTTIQPVEYREKANMEEGLKEKPSPSPSLHVKNCEYQNMCNRFKSTLALPEGYFVPEFNRCYCETCHKIRGDEAYFKRGEPPREFAQPFGWCKFGLRLPAKAEVLNVFEKWHISYYGTAAPLIRKLLDTGDLLKTGDLGSTGQHMLVPQPRVFDEKEKPDEAMDIKQILLSPSIRYISCQHHTPKFIYKDPKSKKTQAARVAFQVCVKPGSYKIGPQSIGANEQIDQRFGNHELEWMTKERGATVLCALLIRIEQ